MPRPDVAQKRQYEADRESQQVDVNACPDPEQSRSALLRPSEHCNARHQAGQKSQYDIRTNRESVPRNRQNDFRLSEGRDIKEKEMLLATTTKTIRLSELHLAKKYSRRTTANYFRSP